MIDFLRPPRSAVLVLAIASALIVPLVASASAASAPRVRTSLTDVEDEVMCVACHEALAVSQSPEAEAERRLIRHLISTGESKAQIKTELVAQYGQAVLALPTARGFNLTVYILPPAMLLAGLALLAFTLPRWRRRSRAAAAESATTGPALDPSEAQRLSEDLARYDA